MTQDILQSDLDVAMRLMNAASADAEIVAALKLRGVSEERAIQVVSELRCGRLVTPVNPMWPGVASDAVDSKTPEEELRPQRSQQASVPRQAQRHRIPSTSGRISPKTGTWTVAVLLFGLAAVGSTALWWVWTQSYHAKTKALLARSQREALNNPDVPGHGAVSKVAAASNAPLPSSGVVFELQSDGLHVAKAAVKTGDALRAMSSVLGPPTRTNWIEQGKVVYAYDRHGVLLYSGEGKTGDSVVLDYEGAGGTNGTSLPFAGNLQMEDYCVQASTSSSALATIKPLGLKNPGDDSGTFRGHWHNLELFFAYLNGPARLSLVEINLNSR